MKLYLYIILLVGVNFFYGQEQFIINKGTKVLGLSFNYGFQKEKIEGATVNPITYRFLIRPGFEYAVKDNLTVGGQLGYTSVRQTTDGSVSERRLDEDSQEQGIGFNAFINKYFSLNKVLLFNVQGSISYQSITQEDFNTNDKAKANQFDIGLTPGVTFRLSHKIALTADFGFIGYVSTNTKDSASFVNDTKEENFEINFDSSNLLIGLVYFIR